jgi:hypothetical protein
MSVASSEVNVQVRFSAEAMALVAQLTDAAVTRAILSTIERVRTYAMGASSNVPVRTGRLKGSFDIASTPRSIVFKWSAVDPKTNYDYAKIQDVGGPNRYGYIAGKYYSAITADFVRMWLIEELTRELEAMQGAVGA